MIVVDASATVAALLNDGASRRMLSAEPLHAPHLIDAEVASVLRRRVRAGGIDAAAGRKALHVHERLGLRRHAMTGLLARMWQLRDNLSAYDAAYVALAEGMDCALVTADRRLSRAPGLRCPVTVVPD